MSTNLTYDTRSLQVRWPPLLAQQLEHWRGLTIITRAQVILEHRREDLRAYQVEVRLEIPGHDLSTLAKDSTLERALLKASRDLEHQIEDSQAAPVKRVKRSQPPTPKVKRRVVRQA